MKSFEKFLCLILSAVALSGCASFDSYMIDRGRDAKDVFTFTIGTGIGAKARVGPFQSGLLIQSDAVGLRGGGWPSGSGSSPRNDVRFFPDTMEYQMIVIGNDCYDPADPLIRERRKRYDALTLAFFSTVKPKCGYCPFYYTQIEVVAALGLSARIGINPGELLDFILSWSKIDIYDDDIEMRKYRAKEEKDKSTHHAEK